MPISNAGGPRRRRHVTSDDDSPTTTSFDQDPKNTEQSQIPRHAGAASTTGQPRVIQDQLVTIEAQREFDLLSGEWQERIFVKMYVAARTSGLLATISDRDWKTLCTLATYMDANGFCFPSQSELAKSLGCSRQMANERIKSLASFRFREQPVLVVVKGSRTDDGRWSRNGYRVLPIASLRIFGNEAGSNPQNPSDDREDTEPFEQTTSAPCQAGLTRSDKESSSVSSRTVTVGLDTNYNHGSNQIHENSNIRIPPTTEKFAAENTSDNEHPRPSAGDNERSTKCEMPRRKIYDEDRQTISAYMEDFSREFYDASPLRSTTTRAYKLFQRSGLPIDEFIGILYQARTITKEQASIRSTSTTDGALPSKNRIPYFFAVVEDLIGLRGGFTETT